MENLIEQAKVECNFKFHDFVADVGNLTIACHLIKVENAVYLWVGNDRDCNMNDLSFAIQSRLAKEPHVTKLIGSIADETSNNLAKRLSKRLSMPVYVSFNVPVDNMSLPIIERRLHEEFKSHPEIL